MGRHPQQAFTLIELMVVVAVLAVLALIAAPSLKDYMLVQRLKGINAQLVTDMQFARSEAVSRNNWIRVAFGSSPSMTCYSLYTTEQSVGSSVRCNCSLGIGSACSTIVGATEVRTVVIPTSLSVTVKPAGAISAFAIDSVTGGIYSIPTDNPATPINGYLIKTAIDASRLLKTTVGRSGRPTVCGSTGTLGAPIC